MTLKAITQGTFCCLKLRNFSFHILSNCSICLRISTHQIFSSSNLKPSPSATSKCILNPWNDVCDSCLYRYQWGKFGSSYLLHKHSDLSFWNLFFQTNIGGKHLRKLRKKRNFLMTFFSEESLWLMVSALDSCCRSPKPGWVIVLWSWAKQFALTELLSTQGWVVQSWVKIT